MNQNTIEEILESFAIKGKVTEAKPFGSGHINDTYCIVCQPKEGKAIRFILQGFFFASLNE